MAYFKNILMKQELLPILKVTDQRLASLGSFLGWQLKVSHLFTPFLHSSLETMSLHWPLNLEQNLASF